MTDFKWDDPFFLDDQLTEDERLIRDTAHDYAQDKLMSRVLIANRARFARSHSPREIWLFKCKSCVLRACCS